MKKEEKIKILQDLIAIRSENDHEAAVAEYCQSLLNNHGIPCRLVAYSLQRKNLVAELKADQTGKLLAFSGHMDVVQAGDESEWTYPPFQGCIADGKIYGRGSSDMKAGLSALLIAMIELKESGQLKKGSIRLLATVGEEVGMLGSQQLTAEGYMDGVDGLLIAEPKIAAGQVITAHKGSVQYEIISHGRSAHSSIPQAGINALQQMVDFIQLSNQRIGQAASQVENDKLGRMLNAYTVIEGGDQINSIPALTKLKGNARTIPELDQQAFISILQESIDEMNEKIEGRLDLHILQANPAIEREFNNPLIQSLQAVSPIEIEGVAMPGATDASNFGQLDQPFDLAIYGPGQVDRAHTVDEYVELDDYLDFITLYSRLALDYLNRDES